MNEPTLFRVEIITASSPPKCYTCLTREGIAELLTDQVVADDLPPHCLIRIYDYEEWNADSTKGLIRTFSILS
ncbi:hypothetical protein IAE29_22880 [Ochrobactrum sp. S46]|nr:hypothetical protein [Ochrobactrum sp. S45]MBK0046178.1 hypothetical protein [Ochrobactrum sp. S46]